MKKLTLLILTGLILSGCAAHFKYDLDLRMDNPFEKEAK